MTKVASKYTVSAAAKILDSKTASKDEKSVAASALSQTKSGASVSKTLTSKATKILHDPNASREAKTVAASTLIKWPAKTPKNAAKIRDAVLKSFKQA